MVPRLGYPKTKKSFQLCPWTPLGAPLQTSERSSSSKFATTPLDLINPQQMITALH